MDELIERIEELTDLNTQLKANNAELEKQVADLLALEGKEKELRDALEAEKRLNEKFKRELEEMQEQYSERLKDLERISLAAATVSPAAIESLGKNVTELQNAAASIQTTADRVKSHAWRYFVFYCFLVACAIGIGGVGLYNLSRLGDRVSIISKNLNDILYILMNQ